jgi:hypothetical protein
MQNSDNIKETNILSRKVELTYFQKLELQFNLIYFKWNSSVIGSNVDRDSSDGIATCYGLDGSGIESRLGVGGGDFRTRPNRPWGPLSLLYNGYRVFPASKAAGTWRWPPTQSSTKVIKRVELYLYSPLGLRDLFYGEFYLTGRKHIKAWLSVRNNTTVPSGLGPPYCPGCPNFQLYTLHLVEFLWTGDRPITGQHTTLRSETFKFPARFEPTIPASERSLESALWNHCRGKSRTLTNEH